MKMTEDEKCEELRKSFPEIRMSEWEERFPGMSCPEYENDGKDWCDLARAKVKERFPSMNDPELDAYLIGMALKLVLETMNDPYGIELHYDPDGDSETGDYWMSSLDQSFSDTTDGDSLFEAVWKLP
jgi:hypothetical protein